MKKLLILGVLTLLAGCTAGMKDSFDCNATAQDSCMTMEEANQKRHSKMCLGTILLMVRAHPKSEQSCRG